MSSRLLTTRNKLVASVALLSTAAGAAGLGSFGSFTSTVSASTQFSSGTVTITLGAAGTAGVGTSANRLSVNASGIVPGDTIQRAVNVINSGTQNFASIVLTTSAAPSSKLDTDPTNGLQMTIQSCGTAWTENSAGAGYTYSCSGGATTVLASRAIIGTTLNLPSLTALTAGQTSYLVITETFPTGADNTFQNLSSTVTYKFDATQRNGTSQ